MISLHVALKETGYEDMFSWIADQIKQNPDTAYMLSCFDARLFENLRKIRDGQCEYFDFTRSDQIFSKIYMKASTVYDYQFTYSEKYLCNSCGAPCTISTYQIARADEPATRELRCTNCGKKKYNRS